MNSLSTQSTSPTARSPVASLLAVAGAALLAFGAPAPANAQDDFATCWGHYEASRWSDAASCFEGLLGEYDGWAWGHHYLGVSYHGAGRADDALKEFLRAAELMASDAEPGYDPHYMAAVILMEQGKNRQAMDALKRGEDLVTAEQRPDYLALRGRISYAMGSYDKAIQDLEASKQRDFETLYAIGTAHYQQENHAAAADWLEKALEKKPQDARAAHFLSLSFFKRAEATGDEATRRRLYRRAAEVGRTMLAANASNPEAHNLLGRALMGSGDYAGAEKEFQAVLRLDSSHCFATANLASLKLARSQPEQAIRHGEKALGCLPADAKRETHLVIANAHAARAKSIGEGAADTDIEARRRAIATYREALASYRRAAALRSTSSVSSQIAAMEGAVADLEEIIATLERNAEIAAENERIDEENRRREERRREVERVTGGSN